MTKLLFILLMLVTVSKAEVVGNDFYIPKTISSEAKSILKTFKIKYREIKNIPKKNDLKGWASLKKKYIGYVKNINLKVIDDFSPLIKEKIISGVRVVEITPTTWNKNKTIILFLHGGAYTLFSAKSSLYNSVPIAHYSGIKIISVDYATAPASKWKNTVEEITKVLKQLKKDGYNYSSIGVLGDSAGGGLAIASILKLRNDEGVMPNAVALWSPWVDVTETGDTYQTLKRSEPTFTYSSLLKHSANAYADIKDYKQPYVSPIYGNFKKGFPKTLIQGGTKELLLSGFVRFYQKLDTSGINVKLDIYEGLWHVFQSHYAIPESKIAINKTSIFFKDNLLPE